MRVVSLIPAATDIVASLGCGDRLVARSHECDWPPEVTRLPVCTRSKLDLECTSAQIDREVKALVGQALSIYEIDAPLLAALEPDLIITQSQCHVCAVSLDDVEAAVGRLVRSAPRIVSLAPANLADILQDVARVAEALEVSSRGTTLVRSLQERMQAIAGSFATAEPRSRVACLEWIDPLMGSGNWIPELVEIAGGVPLLGTAGRHSEWISMPALASANPDVIVMMPCGFGIERTTREMGPLDRDPQWRALAAVRNHECYIADGHHYFNRPGPRLVESAEILSEILHPRAGKRHHEGSGWIKPELSAL